MIKKALAILLTVYAITALADQTVQPRKEIELKPGDVTRVRVAPMADPGERQLTCDEIDKLELIPKVKPTFMSGTVSPAISDSIDKINQKIQAKKDHCAGKIKPKSQNQ